MALPRQIRTLIVEDSEDDTTLLLRELKKAGYDPIHERVETRETMLTALEGQRWDIIFSDYTMPIFKGTDALELLRQKNYDIPFIFVSGTIGEDRAVAAMKAGANDYIIKDNLKRLIPAVDRELREAGVRRERRKAEEALRESNQTLQAVVQSSPLAIIVIDPAGNVQMWNPAAEQIFGWAEREVLGRLIPRVREDGAKDFEVNQDATLRSKGFVNVEQRRQRKDGVLIDVSVSTALLRNAKGETSIMEVIADNTERKRSEAMINQMAFYDTLTDLPNRALLRDRLQQAIVTASYESRSAALLLIDLDRFKEINDTLGHHRGDLLLKDVGSRLGYILSDPNMVAYLGGDEFAILLPMVANIEEVNRVIQKIKESFQPPFTIEGLPIVVEASIGVALYPQHGGNPESLLQRADIAMYAAKEAGSSHVVYDAKCDLHSLERLALMAELRKAIEENQLLLYYQPKISLKSKKVVGVEALARWKHPQRGMIPPDQFIGPAEGTGLIHPLTHWVLRTAMEQARVWQQAGFEITVSANLSARNLLDPRLPETVVGLLRTCGVTSDRMQFEITESAIMTDPVRAQETLVKLHEIGIRFSIDDFGIGYSSLSYLQKLPVDQIKVDKSFVMHMTKNKGDAKIVHSTIELAHNLGLEVVAEGVETQEILDWLIEMGCDSAQGYFISKPLPAEDIDRWLRESPWG